MRVSSRAAKQCGSPATTVVVHGLSCVPVFASCVALQALGSFDEVSSFLAERALPLSQLLQLIHPWQGPVCFSMLLQLCHHGTFSRRLESKDFNKSFELAAEVVNLQRSVVITGPPNWDTAESRISTESGFALGARGLRDTWV